MDEGKQMKRKMTKEADLKASRLELEEHVHSRVAFKETLTANTSSANLTPQVEEHYDMLESWIYTLFTCVLS